MATVAFPLNSSNISPGFAAKVEQSNAAEQTEIDRLRVKHEFWNVYAPEWELYLAAYEGGPDFANAKNIFKHQRETPEDYDDRVRRIDYWNYVEPLVDFFTNFIFTETIQRDGGSNEDFYQSFIKDVNKQGDSISDYMKRVSDDMQIYGMSYTLVENPSLPDAEGNVLTKQQEIELGLRPYWVLITPEEIIDWAKDDFGVFTYFKRMQITREPDVNGVRKYEKYTEWYNDKIIITKIDVTNEMKPILLPASELPNSLGKIPLYLTKFRPSKKYKDMGNSFLRDFAYSSRRILNLTSVLDEFLYRQCFNVLAKEVDTSIPLREQEDGVLGTSNILEYPKGANAPSYLSPPVEPAKFIQEERAKAASEMFKRASQDLQNELTNGEKSSGFSQAQNFSKTVPFIATRADTLEKTENALMSLTFELMGKTWDGKVKYKDRYELTNITDAITQLVSVFRDLMLPSETFVKEELKRLVHELDGKLPPEKLATILKEIDSMDFPEWQQTQKDALVGKAASPAAQQKDKSTGTMQEIAQEARVSGTNSATKKLNQG